VIQILIQNIPHDPDFGSRKGLFNLGPMYESAARVSTPRAITWPKTPDTRTNTEPAGFSAQTIEFLDAHSKIAHGIYGGYNMNDPWLDYSLAWLDPVGAHMNFLPQGKGGYGPPIENPDHEGSFEVFDLIHIGLENPVPPVHQK
jgi:hypothetical protein